MAPSDAERIERLIRGESEAIEELRDWVRQAIGKYRRLLGEDFEDIEQEATLEVLHALDTGRFRGDSSLSTYAHSCARFRAIDALRASGRREVVAIEERVLRSPSPDPYQDAETRDSLEQLHEILRRMSPDCRRLWEMIRDGLSYQEMAEREGVRPGTLRVRVHRCREKALEARRGLKGRVTNPED
jgi:RNA polymerase sigma factor (sigma-70 family)